MAAESPAATLARLVPDLCRMRRGPADVPYSPSLFAVLLVAGTVLDLGTGAALGDGTTAFARSLLSNAVVLGLCGVALGLRHFANRYVQTACALLACSLAFSLLQLPFVFAAGPLPADAAALSNAQLLLGWITLGLLAWQVAVAAHIMRQAIEAPAGLAVVLVLSWVIADWALERAVFGSG
jgi:hypothetical protein